MPKTEKEQKVNNVLNGKEKIVWLYNAIKNAK